MTRSVAVAELVKTLLSATNTYAQILLKIVTKLDFLPGKFRGCGYPILLLVFFNTLMFMRSIEVTRIQWRSDGNILEKDNKRSK